MFARLVLITNNVSAASFSFSVKLTSPLKTALRRHVPQPKTADEQLSHIAFGSLYKSGEATYNVSAHMDVGEDELQLAIYYGAKDIGSPPPEFLPMTTLGKILQSLKTSGILIATASFDFPREFFESQIAIPRPVFSETESENIFGFNTLSGLTYSQVEDELVRASMSINIDATQEKIHVGAFRVENGIPSSRLLQRTFKRMVADTQKFVRPVEAG